MKLLTMRDLTVNQRESSSAMIPLRRRDPIVGTSRRAVPVPTFGERLEGARDGLKRVIIAIWTSHS